MYVNLRNVKPLVSRRKAMDQLLNSCRYFSVQSPDQYQDYQYLQRGKLPMLHFQASLPRLPIPELEKTCQRYLAAQKPLLNPEEYKYTENCVKRFKSSGPQLQKFLKENDKQNKHTSYISGPWFDMYLRDRAPLPVNYNPLLLMKPDERPEYNNQVVRTTNLIISSLRFMKSLKENLLEPEVFHLNPEKSDTDRFRTVMKLVPNFIATYSAYVFKAFPLDMSQYQGLFNATRIPELSKDSIYRVGSSKHLLVVKDGNFFAVDVLDANGNIREPSEIHSQMKYILSTSTENKNPLGVLTTENRDTWAASRKHLESLSQKNKENLNLIDSAIFCLCLDNHTTDMDKPVTGVRKFLFDESKNRWYDKSFSLIVAKDGMAGVNFEHSWGDGVAVLRYFNEIYKETTTRPFVTAESTAAGDIENTIRKLDFDIDGRLENDIKAAEKNHSDIVNSIDMNFLIYDKLNKSILKKLKVSPDSIMQLCFQLAFFKQHHKFVATYESCSTAAFKHGRTETVRPCTSETKDFCESISKKSFSAQELREKIDKCSVKHNNLTKEAAMGQGFDRHLFGLRHVAEERGMPLDEIFKDSAYKRINHNILSTSTLTSNGLFAGGFGPVVNDGYGIGYNIQDKMLGCIVANYKKTRNGVEFLDCLEEAYDEVLEVLKNSTKD